MDLINIIKAAATLDRALTPAVDNAILNALEQNPEHVVDTLMGIAEPLASVLGNTLQAMGWKAPNTDDDEVEDCDFDPMEDDDEITIETHDDEVDEDAAERTIQFLRNVQVALGLDREETYKLLLLMGVEGIIPDREHKHLTATFNEFF